MDLRYSESDQAFRHALRDWLAEAVAEHGLAPKEHVEWSARREYDTSCQRKLGEAGYAGINWPQEYVGRGTA